MSEATGTVKEWAVFVYMCADVPQPGMHTASQNNLQQMLHVGSSKDVWVCAQAANRDQWTYRYIFPERLPGSGPVTIQADEYYPTVDSSSTLAIRDFFLWASKKCPAKKVMLVLWGHGYGLDYYIPQDFHSYEVAELQQRAEQVKQVKFEAAKVPDFLHEFGPQEASGFATDRRPFAGFATDQQPSPSALPPPDHAAFPTDHQRVGSSLPPNIDPAGLQTVSYGTSYPTQSVLLNGQIGDVARQVAKDLPAGQTLEILGFDACEMAMAEVWSEMQHSASIGIASEAGLPYKSWPYDTFLQKLLKKPAAMPADVAKMLLKSFSDSYALVPADYVTLSACDLTGMAALNAEVKILAQALTVASANPVARESIFNARNYCPQYDTQGYIDLGCFCEFLGITMPGTDVATASAAVFKKLSETFVIQSVFSPPREDRKISQSTGISVWMPDWIENPDAVAIEKDLGEAYLSKGYARTQFAVETGWGQFLSTLRAKTWGIHDPGSRRKQLTLDQRAEEFIQYGGKRRGK